MSTDSMVRHLSAAVMDPRQSARHQAALLLVTRCAGWPAGDQLAEVEEVTTLLSAFGRLAGIERADDLADDVRTLARSWPAILDPAAEPMRGA